MTVTLFRVFPQLVKEMEFVDRPVKEILMTIARATGVSIICDKTVTGNASYHFENTDFNTALKIFLDSCGLFFIRKDGIYYVSALYLSYNREKNLLSVKAKDLSPEVILSGIADEIGTTILFDPLPRETVTINAVGLPVYRVIEIITARFDNYHADKHDGYYYIKKKPLLESQTVTRNPFVIEASDGLYSIKGDYAHLNDILSALFRESGREYLLLKRGNPSLENISFSKKSFDGLLGLILEMAGADFTVKNGIYYIFDAPGNGIYKKIENTAYIKLKYISSAVLPGLIPGYLSRSLSIKADNGNNAVIISGPPGEVKPAVDFIRTMEDEYSRRTVKKISLSYLTSGEITRLIPERFKAVHISKTGDPYSLTAESSPELMAQFISFISSADKTGNTYPVRLKYIRSMDLLKAPPPSAGKDSIEESGSPDLVFFKGSEERYVGFSKELEYIDRPVPQIRYELLVVQYQKSSSSEFSFSLKDGINYPGGKSMILGSLGSLIGLNIDVVSSFGYQFAVDLNAKLSDSRARILADTTLNSISGEQTSFRNTNTYRYRDMQIDPDTGKEITTGITREITSGLMININGWISGEGMITMDVKTTISKRGADVSPGTANPPPTSEKIITTHVRTPSGRPVVIGGLFQQENDDTASHTPLLSRIPLVGKLFSSRKDTFEKNEMTVYIVPLIENGEKDKTEPDDMLRNYYDIFFRGGNLWN